MSQASAVQTAPAKSNANSTLLQSLLNKGLLGKKVGAQSSAGSISPNAEEQSQTNQSQIILPKFV